MTLSRTNKIIAFILSLVLTLVSVISMTSTAFADDKTAYDPAKGDMVMSVEKDMFEPIMCKRISDGKGFFVTDEEAEKRMKLNQDIAAKTASGTYSLYDRFGGDLYFVNYCGEKLITTGLLDKIYTKIALEAGDEQSLGVSDVLEMLQREDSVYTNLFYSGRPAIHNSSDDTRFNRLKEYNGNKFLESIALAWNNYALGTAKIITAFTAFFVGDGFLEWVKQFPETFFESDLYNSTIKPLIQSFYWIFAVSLIIFIARSMWKYVKSGETSPREFITNFLLTCLAMGLVAAIVMAPLSFVNVSSKVLALGDDVLADIFNTNASEIVKSDDNSNVIEASLWEISIFKPWVKGSTGYNYDQLYITPDDVTDGGASLNDLYNIDNEQAIMTIGETRVPRGNEEYVNNIAALMYSCTSDYHTPTELVKEEDPDNIEFDEDDWKVWPKASMTSNISVYNDDFKWVDALLNVGNKGNTNAKTAGKDYIDAQPYNSDGTAHWMGFRSLWLAFLLFPLLYIGLMKCYSVLKCLMNVCILFYRSALNCLFPGSHHNLSSALKAMWYPFIAYFWYLILIVIGFYLYKHLADTDNFLLMLVYLFLMLYLIKRKPDTIVNDMRGLKQASQAAALNVSSAVRGSESVRDAVNRWTKQRPGQFKDNVKMHASNVSETVKSESNIWKENFAAFKEDKRSIGEIVRSRKEDKNNPSVISTVGTDQLEERVTSGLGMSDYKKYTKEKRKQDRLNKRNESYNKKVDNRIAHDVKAGRQVKQNGGSRWDSIMSEMREDSAAVRDYNRERANDKRKSNHEAALGSYESRIQEHRNRVNAARNNNQSQQNKPKIRKKNSQ